MRKNCRLARLVRSHRRTTVAQIAEKVNDGYDRKVSEHTAHRSLLHMGLYSRRLIRVPILTPVHRQKHIQGARERQSWTMERWKKVVWSDESCFLLYHIDGWVCRLPREEMAPGCTMGRKQAGKGSLMLWVMCCWETLGVGIHMDVTLTRTTYLNIVADQVHPYMANVFPDGSGGPTSQLSGLGSAANVSMSDTTGHLQIKGLVESMPQQVRAVLAAGDLHNIRQVVVMLLLIGVLVLRLG